LGVFKLQEQKRDVRFHGKVVCDCRRVQVTPWSASLSRSRENCTTSPITSSCHCRSPICSFPWSSCRAPSYSNL